MTIRRSGGSSTPVLVGVDGSPTSKAAVVYAIRSAARRGEDLRVIAAFWPPRAPIMHGKPPAWIHGQWPGYAAAEASALQRAHRVLASAVKQCGLDRSEQPAIEVESLPGDPVDVLVDAADGAAELVVGRRGRRVADAFLGSVSQGCVLYGRCPVTVVPAAASKNPVSTVVLTDAQSTVLVGDDGSEHAAHAVAYALDEAARRSASLRAVAAYEPSGAWVYVDGRAQPPTDPGRTEQVRLATAARVQQAQAQKDERAATVPVEVVAVPGSPASAVLEAAQDVGLIVLGHRGRGGLGSAVLGSVGLSVVLHAPCPVTVVRSPSRRATAAAP